MQTAAVNPLPVEVSESSSLDRRCVRDSLLDAVEDCGSSGSQGGPVEVVVQRVYCIPISRSERVSLQHRTPGRPPSRPQASDHVGRLCAVVQDGYGMFADVLLQRVSTDAEIQKSSEQLEGRVCVLQGLRVIQRLTRDSTCSDKQVAASPARSTCGMGIHGISLHISSQVKAVFSDKQELSRVSGPDGLDGAVERVTGWSKVPTPSFCYRLSVQQGHMVPLSGLDVSPLYRPPVLQTLREITQGSNAGEMLLFVTDLSLQTELNAESIRKSVSVCVSPSCLIPSWVSQALDDSQGRPVLRFRDAVMEQDSDGTGSRRADLQRDPASKTGPADSTNPTALALHSHREGFQCLMCGAMMDEPNTKMRLDVFVCCPSMRHCTVKVKLQQKTITSLLNSTQSPEGYSVEHVLGMEIGPLSALVQVVNTSHAVWMLLEEFDLH
ncbi:DNA repair-scaffolding protein [Triplophysa tibetana]|uniref:DNA repair-scaffolding protein n=1 Tax=Triplophysa tibetana TaxID=1572043 RepID=A0A5A9N378_9TELE|nr:DNA repair-scaffolding protein [Triplophysa tibetana]